MENRSYLRAGALLAPIAGVATGVWAEFADLSPPLLLAVTAPAISVSVISVARLKAWSGPNVLAGSAIGLLTFAISAGLYIAIHYFTSGGFDVNDEESGGSAIMFFAVHVGVGTVVGFVVGASVYLAAHTLNAIRRRGSHLSASGGNPRRA